MPEAKKTEIHLAFARKLHAFRAYEGDQTEPGSGYVKVALTYFRCTWCQERPNLKVRLWQRFAICDDCAAFQARLRQTAVRIQKLAILVDYRAHIAHQMAQRRSYYSRRLLA